MTTSNDLDGKAAVSLNVSPASVMDLSREDAIKAALDGDTKAAFRVELMAQSGEIDDATRDLVREAHPDGPRPDPRMMIRLKADQLAANLDGLDDTAKAAYLLANPGFVPELIDLTRAGSAATYAALEGLVKLDLLGGRGLGRVWRDSQTGG